MKLKLSIIAKLECNSLIPEDPYESYAPKYRTIGALAYNRDQAIWYKGTELESSFSVDFSNFREEIFPYSWNSWGAWSMFFESTITSDGTIILSTTGPSGLAVIGLRWTP
jgi:hypothetical protein